MSDVRMPTQQRSIEKREKIIKYGFELMCNEGFHNVNSKDIAKYAGVSTGIIYQYFNDKREIFIEGVKNYSNNITFPMIDVLTDIKLDKNNLEEVIRRIINEFVKNHTMSKKAHEELMAMSHLDKDVRKIFTNNEIAMSERIVNYLKDSGFILTNIHEKVHIIIGIVDNYCHEVVYHKHDILNYVLMEDELIKTIEFILKK